MKLRSMKALEAPEEPVVLSPERYRKYKITALIVVIVGAVLLIAFVFGLVSYTTMREQEELHQQQLELLRDKTTSLEEKMDKMDSLDQELRQMVKGAGAGESPKGEGSVVGQKRKAKIYHMPDIMNYCTLPPVWKQRVMPELSALLR